MDLKERLARLDRLTRKPDPATAPPPATVAVPPPPAASTADERALLTGALGLDAQDADDGTVWLRDDVTLAPAPPRSPLPDVAGILPAGRPRDLSPAEILFLDTETTGLAGGTGSLVFLLGLGWWEAGRFTVRQYFLSAPGRERPLLREAAALARRFRVVVTYNGGSFDLPLLRTRALLSRCDDPCADLVSWDLLTAVRRLWGRRLPDCRQPSAEGGVCGLVRGPGDIDGSLIPAAYFRYLHDGDAALLPSVLEHNRRDVRGMAHLLEEVLTAAATLSPPPGPRDPWPAPWQDAWQRGRICERRRLDADAAAWLARALAEAGVGALAPERLGVPPRCFFDALRVLKRTAQWDRVAAVLDAALACHPDEPRLHREAAIFFEHRRRDPARALRHAETLGEPRRLARLRARLGRS